MTMPNHSCCVAMCKSRNKRDDVKFIKFPADPVLADKWRFVIGREPDFKVTKNTRICSLHFVSGKRSSEAKCVDYIPSIFPFQGVTRIQFNPFAAFGVNKCNVDLSNVPFASFENQFGDSGMKRRLCCRESPADDVQCEPDIYPLTSFPCLKTVACQTDLTETEIDDLLTTKSHLINEIQSLRQEISYLKLTNTSNATDFRPNEQMKEETALQNNDAYFEPKLNVNIVLI